MTLFNLLFCFTFLYTYSITVDITLCGQSIEGIKKWVPCCEVPKQHTWVILNEYSSERV